MNLKKIFSVCNSYISFIIQGISIQYKSPRVFSKPTKKNFSGRSTRNTPGTTISSAGGSPGPSSRIGTGSTPGTTAGGESDISQVGELGLGVGK